MNTEWRRTNQSIFWGEISPCDHVVQIYEDKGNFLDILTGFVGEGINSDDSVIVIATKEHIEGLERRLITHGLYVDFLIHEHRYIPVDADELLSAFMVKDWPDPDLFKKEINKLIEYAGEKGRKIRAFGEMVALLWSRGQNGATVQLEHLWNHFKEKNHLSLFCAYPKSGFTQDINNSINQICGCHTTMITNSSAVDEILYRNIA
ncbi:MAG: MEDS domain-containing protein [Chitinophagaceae bacterium]